MCAKEAHVDVVKQVVGEKNSSLRYASACSVKVPLYLYKSRHSQLLIARFRCENEERGREKWRGERRCRVCGAAEETLEHMKERCCRELSDIEEILRDGCRNSGDEIHFKL